MVQKHLENYIACAFVPVFILKFLKNSSLLFDIKCCLIQPVTILYLYNFFCRVCSFKKRIRTIRTHKAFSFASLNLMEILYRYSRIHMFFFLLLLHSPITVLPFMIPISLTFTSCTRILYACLHCHHLSAIDAESSSSFSLRIQQFYFYTIFGNIPWKWAKREEKKVMPNTKKIWKQRWFWRMYMPILLCNLTRYKTYNQINDKTDRVSS